MGASTGILVQWFTLNARKNNRGETRGNLFLAATEEYCWPSRVRTGKGGENAVVAGLTIERSCICTVNKVQCI